MLYIAVSSPNPSDVLALELSAPMFSPIHSIYKFIFCNDPEFLKTPFPCSYNMRQLISPLTLTPDTRNLTTEPRFVNRQGSAFTNGLD
ncbi:MAG: hypothetical protein DRH24_00970 [Deltaproteobacteria bacterium]|nr:MAG: hypothetical protein DRH24_00970 [Deltaproteobacteria bacterium]